MSKSPLLEFQTHLKRIIGNEIQDVHTALPGEITAVDAVRGLCTVKLFAKRTVGKTEVDFPPVVSVPLVFPYTDKVGLVYPVKTGDSCLVIFSEQATEEWLGLGDTKGEVSHSLSGAMCIPGLMRKPTKDFQKAQREDAVIIRNKDAEIMLTEGRIVLKGDVYVTGHLHTPDDEMA